MNNFFRKSQFKKDFKRILKQGKNPQDFEAVLLLLMAGSELPERLNDHPLHGNWEECRELHIKPDWLFVYRISGDTLELVRTGSHSELLGK